MRRKTFTLIAAITLAFLMVFAFIYTKKKEAETKGHKEAEKVLLEMEYPWRKLNYASSDKYLLMRVNQEISASRLSDKEKNAEKSWAFSEWEKYHQTDNGQ